MRDSIRSAIQEHITVPEHIRVAANMVRHDLLHGPAWARIPKAGVEHITDDDLASFQEDLEDEMEDGDKLEQVYSGQVAAALREFIDDMPGTLWVDDDCGCVLEREPEGEEIDGEWFDAPECYVLDGTDIVECVFGKTLAREFR